MDCFSPVLSVLREMLPPGCSLSKSFWMFSSKFFIPREWSILHNGCEYFARWSLFGFGLLSGILGAYY
jgi:hypothetical protein